MTGATTKEKQTHNQTNKQTKGEKCGVRNVNVREMSVREKCQTSSHLLTMNTVARMNAMGGNHW